MNIKKNGIIDVNIQKSSIKNLYSGKQVNGSNCSFQYNYATDIFNPYGFTSCTRMNPISESNRNYSNKDTKQFMTYSYLINASEQRTKGGIFAISMYAYVSEDCDADFRLHLEHSCSYTETYNNSTSKTILIDSTKGKVIWVWAKFKSNVDDGKIYIMFYPNPNLTNVFTKGYVLFTGIQVYEDTTIYRPSQENSIHGIYSIPNSSNIYSNKMEFEDFIEY